jgi:hypothetical protein
MTVMKYLRLDNFRNKMAYLAHNSGGSRACHQHQLGSGEYHLLDSIMVDGIMMGTSVSRRAHKVKQEESQSEDKGQQRPSTKPHLLKCHYLLSLPH